MGSRMAFLATRLTATFLPSPALARFASQSVRRRGLGGVSGILLAGCQLPLQIGNLLLLLGDLLVALGDLLRLLRNLFPQLFVLSAESPRLLPQFLPIDLISTQRISLTRPVPPSRQDCSHCQVAS